MELEKDNYKTDGSQNRIVYLQQVYLYLWFFSAEFKVWCITYLLWLQKAQNRIHNYRAMYIATYSIFVIHGSRIRQSQDMIWFSFGAMRRVLSEWLGNYEVNLIWFPSTPSDRHLAIPGLTAHEDVIIRSSQVAIRREGAVPNACHAQVLVCVHLY